MREQEKGESEKLRPIREREKVRRRRQSNDKVRKIKEMKIVRQFDSKKNPVIKGKLSGTKLCFKTCSKESEKVKRSGKENRQQHELVVQYLVVRYAKKGG